MPPTPTTAVERREMPSQDAPTVAALDRLSNDQIRYIAGTEIVPKHLRNKPDAMLATILKGRALGLDDIHSLTAINFIDGRATLTAEAMTALVRQKGHSIAIELTPGTSATAKGRRKDTGDEIAVTWTMGMAKDAGLAGKDNWKRHPDTMLQWRAISQVCRFLFADVLMGVSYTEDEAVEASERGAVTQAVAGLEGVGEQQIRTEPLAGPSEAQLNRIARLEERSREFTGSDGGYKMVLRGVYGVEMASELDADSATKYEAQLEMALPPEDSGQGAVSDSSAGHAAAVDERGAGEAPQGDEAPTPAAPTDSAGDPSGFEDSAGTDGSATGAEAVGEAGDEPGVEADPSPADADSDAEQTVDNPSSAAASEELPGEPAPDDDDVIDVEVVEEIPYERLVELAAETAIPIGDYKGMKLADIHPGWIEYALTPANSARLPGPFIEALEIFAKERKPEIWQAVRGE